MKNLIIIGARGFGRETYNLAISCTQYDKEWVVKGFLDDKKNALDGFNNYPPVLGPVEDYVPQEDDVFITALGSVHYKEKYASMILEKGGEFINLIHPTAIIHANVQMGKGITINAYTTICNDVKLADFVTIQGYVVLGHDVEAGTWSHFTSFTFLGGFTKVGKSVTVYAGVKIIDKRTIGDNAIIGVGSVVIKNVKPGVTVFGNPAKEI